MIILMLTVGVLLGIALIAGGIAMLRSPNAAGCIFYFLFVASLVALLLWLSGRYLFGLLGLVSWFLVAGQLTMDLIAQAVLITTLFLGFLCGG